MASDTRADGGIEAAVEEFIAVNEVDGSAADALRDCPRPVQQAVIDRGGLSGARNPSSVLLARIRDASAPPLITDGDILDGAGYVRLRGIPFSATPDDILHFFDGLGPLTEGVVIGTTREGRLSGEAFVQFPNPAMAKEAIEQRNRATMGDRYIELFPSTPGEAQRAQHSDPRLAGGAGDNKSWGSDDRSGNGYWGQTSLGDRSITEEEVEHFLNSSTIDEHAAVALRELPPSMQAAVIDRGGLGNARNPSSVLLSRIRDVQNGAFVTPPPPPPAVIPPSRRQPGGSMADRIERFLEENLVDEQAAEALRNCHPDAQEEVIQRGVASARNPSSALRARIRDAESAILGGGGGGGGPARPSQAPRGGGNPTSNFAATVEDFIHANGIDDRAAETLRSCHPRVQEVVLDRGDLHGTRNPSSALLARIRDAQNNSHHSSDRDTYAQHGGPSRGYDDGYGGRAGGRDSRPYSLEDIVEDFIRANYLDERAADALRSCAPGVQEAVLERGDLSGTRNPSSAILARLKDIQGGPPGPGRQGHQPSTGPCTIPGPLVDDIEYLLRVYADRDERAADALGRLRNVKYNAPPPPGGGDYYYDSAGYSDPRDAGPHGSRNARSYSPRGSRHYSERDRMEDQIEAFCRANGIDAKAMDALRRTDPRIAYAVMEKGVSGARNPSSAMLARLREYEQGGSGGRDRGYEPEPSHRKRSRLEDDVEAFIRSNGVDEMAADALRRCSPDLQEVVMEKGVSGARNPSSALLARIRDLDGRGSGGDRRGYATAPPRRGGDRYAPY